MNSKHTGGWVFFRALWAHPQEIGAPWPSSKKLADYLAQQVPLPTPGKIVELGPGTGVVTQALLRRGISQENLIAIEHSSSLAAYLREAFPKLEIIEGDAAQLTDLLKDQHKPISAIVSSLPLHSLPKATVKAIFQQLDQVLKQGDLFIQFTYDLRKKSLLVPTQFTLRSSKIIWLNFPPARVSICEHV